jgi:hypothetical protein
VKLLACIQVFRETNLRILKRPHGTSSRDLPSELHKIKCEVNSYRSHAHYHSRVFLKICCTEVIKLLIYYYFLNQVVYG